MPKKAIFPEKFCHRAYQKSKQEDRYAQESDFPGKFQSPGIPGKQERGIGMPEGAIFPGNFCRGAYRRSKRGE